MANPDAPFGLRPVRHMSGAPYNGACNAYYVPSDYGTALYIGDPVVLVGDSNDAEVSAPGAGTWGQGMLSEINICTAGDNNPVLGAIVGFAASPTNLSLQYNPASTERIVYVADDPDLIFHIRDDGTGTPASDTIGLNCNIALDTAGSTVTGLSGAELDASAFAADPSNQLLVMRVLNSPDNTIGDNAVWEVMISRHQLRTADGITGVA